MFLSLNPIPPGNKCFFYAAEKLAKINGKMNVAQDKVNLGRIPEGQSLQKLSFTSH